MREGNIFTPVCDSIHRRVPPEGDRCPEGYLSIGVSVQGILVSVQGVGLCRGGWFLSRGFLSGGGSLSRGSLSRGSLSRRSLSGGSLCQAETPRTVTRGRYVSYWNVFLFAIFKSDKTLTVTLAAVDGSDVQCKSGFSDAPVRREIDVDSVGL